MGRYYSGDIDGKFWFAVQSSMAAERFGAEVEECEEDEGYMVFSFKKEDLPKVQAEIKNIKENLGIVYVYFKEFFGKNNGYNEQMLKEFFDSKDDVELSPEHIKDYLQEYADIGLGEKIEKCIIDEGECVFTGEL